MYLQFAVSLGKDGDDSGFFFNFFVTQDENRYITVMHVQNQKGIPSDIPKDPTDDHKIYIVR